MSQGAFVLRLFDPILSACRIFIALTPRFRRARHSLVFFGFGFIISHSLAVSSRPSAVNSPAPSHSPPSMVTTSPFTYPAPLLGKRGGLRQHGRTRKKGENDHGTDQTPLLHIETTHGAAKRTNLTRYNWMEESRLENKEIARVLWETADLMEIAGEDSFRIRSYRNGATAVEGYPERIVDILRDPQRKVTDIPGIGKGLAHVLAEIEERGS